MFNGNKIFKIDKNGKRHRVLFIPGLKIKFTGKNSSVTLYEPIPRFRCCKITLENNCHAVIKGSIHIIKKLQAFLKADNCRLYIGRNLSTTNGCEIHISPDNNRGVFIGDSCMFGRNIIIRATDGHAVMNQQNGEIINTGKNVYIGNHVWLAERVTVLKGVTIANDSILSFGSVAAKSCSIPNSVYAGIPAKPVKHGINWNREYHLDKILKKESYERQ